MRTTTASLARTPLTTILVTPWRTVHRSLRWLGGVVTLLLCAAAMGITLYVGGPQGWRYGTMLYVFGAAYFWLCVMACLLLVAIDARRLRVPGVQTAVVASMLLYAAVTVAVPLVMLVPLGGDSTTIALMAALAAGVGLAVALLPRYVALLWGFLPAFAIAGRHLVSIPFPGQPGLPPFGAAILVTVVIANVIRWRQLLRAEAPCEVGMGSAMVMQYRRHGAMGGGMAGTLWRGDATATGRRQGRASPQVRLDGVGPQAPVLALRVALGEGHAPRTLRSRGQRFARLWLPLLLFIPVMALMQAGEAHGDVLPKVMRGAAANVVGWLGVMGGAALMAMGSLSFWTRWRRANAEMPLLALLPGLGDGAVLRRHLLRAALTAPLSMQALLLACVLGAAVALHAGLPMLLLLTLAQLGCAATVIVLALGSFGGTPLPGWGVGVLLTAMTVLVAASTFVPMFATLGRHPHPLGEGASVGLVIAWSLAATVLFWLGQRGWRNLLQRPHPFLVD